jgi:zinc protease
MTTIDRTLAPDFKAIDNINLIRPEHVKLDNGCDIFCFNSGGQELVRIEWIFGNLRFNPALPLLNMAVNTMLTEGTQTLTAAQIADKVDFYGAFLQVEYGYENSQVVLYSLNKHLHHTLPVIVDILTNSTFPEKNWKHLSATNSKSYRLACKKTIL